MGIATLILAFERHNALRYLCRRFYSLRSSERGS
jgi:hypothetical protein